MAKIFRKTHNPYALCTITHSLTLKSKLVFTIKIPQGGCSLSVLVLSLLSGSPMTSMVGVFSNLSIDDLCVGCGGGPLAMILSQLTSSSAMMDLSAHQDALQLAGHVFAGTYTQVRGDIKIQALAMARFCKLLQTLATSGSPTLLATFCQQSPFPDNPLMTY